jgi:regulatory protein YycI of two-component signal transduction system YycFG
MWKKYKMPIIVLFLSLLLVAGLFVYQKKKKSKAGNGSASDNNEEASDDMSQLSEGAASTDSDKANVQRALSAVGA